MANNISLLDIPEYLITVPSPIGRLELTSDGRSVASLSVERDGELPHDDLPYRSNPLLDEAARQLGEYFSGDRRAFDLPLEPEGTRFQRAVWKALDLVPYGTVTTYGQLGYVTIGSPSGRAVGTAIRANPLPILIPSHRVVNASGRITGFSEGDGPETKAWLLSHEGAEFRQ